MSYDVLMEQKEIIAFATIIEPDKSVYLYSLSRLYTNGRPNLILDSSKRMEGGQVHLILLACSRLMTC